MEETKARKPTERSSAYPFYTILFCVDLVKKITATFGSSIHILREDISKAFKVSLSTINPQLSAAVHYGLLEVKAKVGYKPTELFKRITKYLTEAERSDALYQALTTPELYLRLLNDLGDESISLNGLAIKLNRHHNIAENASERAANIFLTNLNDLKLIDDDGRFKLNSKKDVQDTAVSSSEENKNENNIGSKISPSPRQELKVTPTSEQRILEIALKNDRVAKLIYPKDVDEKDLDKITKFIDALRE